MILDIDMSYLKQNFVENYNLHDELTPTTNSY